MSSSFNESDFEYYVNMALHDMKSFGYILAEAEKGDAEAMYQLGYQYRLKGKVTDYQKAVYWYQQAAERNHADASNDLGYICLEGCLETQDYSKAMEYFRYASSLGSSTAQYNLGHMFMNGLGVPINYKQALKWYRKSAAKGYAKAQNNIGYMYQNGLGMNPNYKKAISWYQSAAGQDEARAQYHLGEMHEKGQGCPYDIEEALEWYGLSAKQGDRDALSALRRLSVIKNKLLLRSEQVCVDSDTLNEDQDTNKSHESKARRRRNNRKKRNDMKKEQEEKEKENMLKRIKDLEDRYDKSMHVLEYIVSNEENNFGENTLDRIKVLEEQMVEQKEVTQRTNALSNNDKEELQYMSQRMKILENMIEQMNISLEDSTDETKGKSLRNTPIFF